MATADDESTTPEETPAAPAAKPAAAAPSSGGGRSEEEKAKRKERVQRAKDAMARSVSLRGEHVAPARASLKLYLQRLNEPKQPDDALFEILVEAPFKAPPKKKTNDRRF